MKLISLQRRSRFVWKLAAIPLLTIAIFLAPASMQSELVYARASVANGEYWRLVTAHFVHQDARHLALNLTSWILMTTWGHFVLQQTLSWTKTVFSCCLMVGLGLFYFDPQIPAYIGLSGVLYGSFVADLTISALVSNQLARLGLVLVFGKLLFDKFFGHDFGSLLLSPSQISAVHAHLWGALTGCCFGIWNRFCRLSPNRHASTSCVRNDAP